MMPGMFSGAASTGVAPGSLYDEIIADSPWGYWQLGETAGATSYADSSGNSRDLGELAATLTAGSAALVSPGTSVDFNGSAHITCTNNQYGAAQAAAFNGDLPISYCFVFRLDALGSSRVPIHLGSVSISGSQGAFVEIRSDGTIRFQMFVGGSYKFFDTAAGVISTGVTYIVHARRNTGGAAAIFVNGTSAATSAGLTGSIAMAASSSSGGQRIMLGAQNGSTPGQKIDGRLQHVAVFDSVLSDARIAAQVSASGL